MSPQLIIKRPEETSTFAPGHPGGQGDGCPSKSPGMLQASLLGAVLAPGPF